jgi:hypothetical protein
MTSFDNPKNLLFVITLGTGTFGSSNNNQIQLEGFRARAHIENAGGQMYGTLHAQIYGVSQSDMNQATTLQYQNQGFLRNVIQVYAIDGTQKTLVFVGNIINAFGNYNSAPDVFLEIQANSTWVAKLTPTSPLSYPGSIPVSTVMQKIADTIGVAFQNNGVTKSLINPYLPGTAPDQAQAVVQQANIDMYLDGQNLAICPKGQPRDGQIPEISPSSGLIGYPTFDGVGVNFRTFFNPAITFGGAIKLVTSIPRAAGQWVVTSINHDLAAQEPGGQWFSTVRGNASGLLVTS